MPKITLQITVSDAMKQQIDLLCTEAAPLEVILQNALQFGLQDMFDVASNRYRDFLENNAAHLTAMFARYYENRKVVVTVKDGDARLTLPKT